jgi:Holliday junction resolvase RusA-like endonuclease
MRPPHWWPLPKSADLSELYVVEQADARGITLRIHEPAVAWQRAGYSRSTGAHYTKPETRAWQTKIRSLASAAMIEAQGLAWRPWPGPISLHVDLWWAFPSSWSRAKCQRAGYHTSRPDTSNCLKSVEDALNGVAYFDDSQISLLSAAKQYGPRAMVRIEVARIAE